MTYITDTRINRDLVLDFFLHLSRFEFALKVTGYARGNETRVDPDWDRFTAELAPRFVKDRTRALSDACDCLTHNPPNKQILVDGTLDWSATLPCNPDRECELILGISRRVRNNLSHGGKYNAQAHDETARNEALLNAVIVILQECMHMAPEVRNAFDQTAI